MLVSAYDAIPGDVAQAVRSLLQQCFGRMGMTDDWRQEQDDRFCSQGDVLKHVIAVDGEEVIGFARAYRRTITRHDRAVILGGLGAVCTAPARRHAGVATAVVRAALHELHMVQCDLAYLCAEVSNPGIVRLYGQVGFVPLNRPHTFVGQSGKRYTDMDAMIAPVTSALVFEEVLGDREPFDIGTGNW